MDEKDKSMYPAKKKEVQAFANQLIGAKLLSLSCACELLCFGFSNNMALHASHLCRIISDGDILVTTLDYHSWDELDSKHNDEWENVNRFKDKILGGSVLSAAVNEINDLKIVLDNGIVVECLIANAYSHYTEEQEQWFLFEHTEDNTGRFLTAYSKHLEWW